jgi:hypothetical protein
VSTDSTVATLLALYESADADTVRRGREWYAAARRECRKIARDTGYSVKQVAAVMAVTSPDAQLRTNIAWTRKACESRGTDKVGKYPNMQRPKVIGALADADNPGQYATGPKVSAFYSAIIGDESAMVVDRWAAFAAGYPERDRIRSLPVKIRRVIEAAYREAASLVGETVAAFQAIVWIVIRESTPRVNGVSQGLADITV